MIVEELVIRADSIIVCLVVVKELMKLVIVEEPVTVVVAVEPT